MDGLITCRIDYSVLQGHFEAFLFLSIAAHNQFSTIVISLGKMLLILHVSWSPLPLGIVKHWHSILGLPPSYLLTSSHRRLTLTTFAPRGLSLFLCQIRTELGGKAFVCRSLCMT